MTEKDSKAKASEKADDKVDAKVDEKAEAETMEAVEAHVETDNTEMPDHSAIRAVEAHRQAAVGRLKPVDTGDDSAVHPQPDRDEAVGDPRVYLAQPDGERQVTEQPDRYAVSGDAEGAAVEPNAKNRRGRKSSKKDEVDFSTRPAQYEGDGKDELPAQHSF